MRSDPARLRSIAAAPAALVLLGATLGACGSAAPTAPPATEPPAATQAPTIQATHELAVGATCTGRQQLCVPPVRVTIWTEDRLVVEFTASAGHCSPVIVHLGLDGEEIFASPPLDAGISTGTQDLGPVPVGEHVVELQAEGVTGGCNSGVLANWGGTLRLSVAGLPGPYPTPKLESTAPLINAP